MEIHCRLIALFPKKEKKNPYLRNKPKRLAASTFRQLDYFFRPFHHVLHVFLSKLRIQGLFAERRAVIEVRIVNPKSVSRMHDSHTEPNIRANNQSKCINATDTRSDAHGDQFECICSCRTNGPTR